MSTKKWSTFIRERHSAEEIAASKREASDELKLLDLRSLRELAGETQAEMASRLQVSQAELSRAERRRNLTLATLRKYIEALGGSMVIVAQFRDRSYQLRSAWTEESPPAESVKVKKRRPSSRPSSKGGRPTIRLLASSPSLGRAATELIDTEDDQRPRKQAVG